MRSKKKTKSGSCILPRFIPQTSSFAQMMKTVKKRKSSLVDHNMIFVSYLLEQEMRAQLKNNLTDSAGK